jgi:hypothetical protein
MGPIMVATVTVMVARILWLWYRHHQLAKKRKKEFVLSPFVLLITAEGR